MFARIDKSRQTYAAGSDCCAVQLNIRLMSATATTLDFPEHDAAVGDGTAFALGVNDQRVDVHFRDFRVVGHHFGNA